MICIAVRSLQLRGLHHYEGGLAAWTAALTESYNLSQEQPSKKRRQLVELLEGCCHRSAVRAGLHVILKCHEATILWSPMAVRQ